MGLLQVVLQSVKMVCLKCCFFGRISRIRIWSAVDSGSSQISYSDVRIAKIWIPYPVWYADFFLQVSFISYGSEQSPFVQETGEPSWSKDEENDGDLCDTCCRPRHRFYGRFYRSFHRRNGCQCHNSLFAYFVIYLTDACRPVSVSLVPLCRRVAEGDLRQRLWREECFLSRRALLPSQRSRGSTGREESYNWSRYRTITLSWIPYRLSDFPFPIFKLCFDFSLITGILGSEMFM